MEFRQLRYFLCVIKHGSINRAASALNVTQPSLSHSIKALERSVGAQLLLRSGGGVRPTPIGEVFERYAQNIMREAEKAMGEVSSLRGGGRSKLSVGVMSVFSLHFAPQVVSKFLTATPAVDVEMFSFTFNGETVIKQLQAAEWDLALTFVDDAFECPSDIEVRRLGPSQSHVYCSADHPLASKRRVTLEDMAAFSWAVTNVGSSERKLTEVFAEVGLEPDVRVRTNSLNQVMSLTYAHPSLCILPEQSVGDDLKMGRLVRVDQDSIHTQATIAIMHSNLAERTTSMRTFIRLCAEEAAPVYMTKVA